VQLRHADGHLVPVEGNAGPFELAGRPGMISVIRDLTSRQEAERVIALAEARQRATIQTITDGIVVYDLDDDRRPKAVLMNPAALDFIGYPIGELQGSFDWSYSVVVDADGAPVEPARIPVVVVARTGKSYSTVLGFTPPGGTQRWLRVSANPIADRSGEMVGIVTGLVDITKELADRVKAEADTARLAELVRVGIESDQALRESEERFHLLFEHAPIGMSLISLDGRYQQTNPAMWHLTGYSEEQLKALSVTSTTHPDDHVAEVAARETLLAGPARSYTIEKRAVTATGTVVWVHASVSLVRSEDGSPRHFIAQLQDISERRKREEALTLERRRLRAAQSAAHIGSWEMDVCTGDVVWSDTLLELYGLDRASSPGDLVSVLARIHPNDRDAFDTVTEACQRTGDPMYLRHRVVRAKDGRLRWLDTYGVGTYENDRLVRLAGAVIDVTDQVLVAREAKEGRDLAVEASRQKSAFLATMSHEIRTPMNAVIGMTGLLLDTDLDAEQREFVETVRTGGDSLLVIINDILDFSKIEAGSLRLEQQPFDLRDCVDDAVDLVAATPSAQGLKLVVDIQEGCPAAVVGDVTRLRQVLVNLLGNAAKFTPYGEVVLSVQPADHPVGEDHQDGQIALRFAVTDTGIGIPPDRIAGLFDSFIQGDASTTRLYGGTGLGLAISRRLVDAMGGTLAVDSVIGQGSAFYFSIVLGRTAATIAADVPPPDESTAGGTGPLRVLLAEDNSVNQRLARLMVEKLGHHVDVVGNGQEAADAVRLVHYDAVLMDLEMPVMDGLDATRTIRRSLPPRGQPEIVAMTASALVEDRKACYAAGMDDYLAKPVRIQDLRVALERAARQRQVKKAMTSDGSDPRER
jgi:PAS domain S-box-containing protein